MNCRFVDAMWAVVFIAVCISSCAESANAEEDNLDAMLGLFKGDGRDFWSELKDDEKLVWLKRNSCAIDSDMRLAVANRLANWAGKERDAILEELLSDDDILVRYSAVKAKYGMKAEESENVRRHKIEEVVQSRETTEDLVKKLSMGTLKEKYAATQALIKIGPSSLPHFYPFKSPDRSVQLSLLFVAQEVEAARGNIKPGWAVDIEGKLKKEISFDFVDVPLEDAIKQVSKLADLDIRFDEFVIRDGMEKQHVSLRVKDMKASTALEWLIKLTDLETVLREKAVQVTKRPNIACGPELIILDVRDLEAAGIPANAWKELLRRDVPGVMDDVTSSCHVSGGFLVFMTPMSGAGYGRVWAKPIVNYLNSVRKTLDLKPVEWKINGK